VHGHKVRPETRAQTASSAKDLLKRFYFDTLTHDAQALRYLVELVGAERIVVGTDAPFDMGDENPRATLSRFAPEEVATLRRNALRLLEE
jgi:aminocarboxymuconate-semialdehyde decarboxylase